jgi:hypothetical protein
VGGGRPPGNPEGSIALLHYAAMLLAGDVQANGWDADARRAALDAHQRPERLF